MNGLSRWMPEKLGGAKVAAGMGACALTAATEDEAPAEGPVRCWRCCPPAIWRTAEIVDADDLNRLLPAIDPADADALLNAAGRSAVRCMELYAAYEPSVKRGRWPVWAATAWVVVAANGKLTAGALQKAARFVRFMDCYGIRRGQPAEHLRRGT